jgi:GTP-binding protein
MKLPALVIVGRPNVGKSSLFNRILGKRKAIVHEEPGITRDRIYATSQWQGRPFALIDTGGLLPGTQDPMLEAVREQVEFAADEAARILFVLDWETGVTDWDMVIGKFLHRLNKPITAVINKADDDIRDQDPRDFYQLGFSSLHFVSAMRGRGIGDLLDAVVDFPESSEEPHQESLRIAILGRPNVGKSSMVNALTGKTSVVVSEIPGTTRDSTDTPLRFQGQEVILVDTAGLRRKGKTKESVEFYSELRTARALERADVVWLVMDATEGMVTEDMRIIDQVYEAGKGILLMMNKWDTVKKDHTTAIDWEKRLHLILGRFSHLPMLFVSALQKQRLIKALEISFEIQEQRTRRITTSQLNAVLEPIIEHTPPPSYRGHWVRIKYVTQIRTTPPLFGFFCNRPEGITTSYRRYLERALRENFGFSGVPIKMVFRKK